MTAILHLCDEDNATGWLCCALQWEVSGFQSAKGCVRSPQFPAGPYTW